MLARVVVLALASAIPVTPTASNGQVADGSTGASDGRTVDVVPVPPPSSWPDSVEEGALGRACADTADGLAGWYKEEGQPFRQDLVRHDSGRACHVLYRPSVRGFRASPDDDRIAELLVDADPLLYLATARENGGDALGAVTEVLQWVPRPLKVRVFTQRVHEAAAYEAATERALGETPHEVVLRDGGDRALWRVQDLVKSGRSPRGQALLVTHRAPNRQAGRNAAYEELLERILEDARAVRSHLTWEGGDLQFTRDPWDETKLVLFYGDAVRQAWGKSLSQGEIEYVLCLEFGADRAVDLGGVASRVEDFVSFLAPEAVALAAEPHSGDLDVARAVVTRLLARFNNPRPPTLRQLEEALASPNPDPREIARLIGEARRLQGIWTAGVDEELLTRTEALESQVCPDRADCFTPADQARLAAADPDLFEEWIHSVRFSQDLQSVVTAHLDLLQGQLEPIPEEILSRSRERAAELEGMGFRVIRVPAFRVDLRQRRAWSGISYANALVVDEQVFVPRFGLGEIEDGVLRLLDVKLPEGYSLVPVHAERAMIRSGGLHSLAGLIRTPSR